MNMKCFVADRLAGTTQSMGFVYTRHPMRPLSPKLYGHAIVSERKARLIVDRVQRGTYNTDMYSGGYAIIGI